MGLSEGLELGDVHIAFERQVARNLQAFLLDISSTEPPFSTICALVVVK